MGDKKKQLIKTGREVKTFRKFPLFYPVRPAHVAEEWHWSPYTVWWVIILAATYFTVFFVPYEVSFTRETYGTLLMASAVRCSSVWVA
jgi:hypothetical protein